MSETAATLIKGALRAIGVIATGETPSDDEMQDGLQALQFMVRNWSANNIRIPWMTEENFPLTGAAYYTIGSGGTFNTVRPVDIRGAFVRDSNSVDHVLRIIDEAKYRALSLKSLVDTADYLWYSPEFPLGKIFLWPVAGGTLYLDSVKPLTDPSVITSSVSFPPEYDEAIKYNLALRLAPEYGKEASATVIALAGVGLKAIENRNFASQINAVRPEIIRVARSFNIEEG